MNELLTAFINTESSAENKVVLPIPKSVPLSYAIELVTHVELDHLVK